MKFDAIQSNFTSGELSPQLQSRVDLEAFKNGVSKCENMVVQTHGGLNYRGGFHYVDTVKDSAKPPILVEFNHISEYSYLLEFGENYIRFYIDHQQIKVEVMPEGTMPEQYLPKDNISFGLKGLRGVPFPRTPQVTQDILFGASGDPAYEVDTTYAYSELKELYFAQDGEAMYITHPNHIPAKLTRAAHDDWTLVDITFNFSDSDIWQRYNIHNIVPNVYANDYIQGVCWSPKLELFVAVSDSRTSWYQQTMRSSDGKSWSGSQSAKDYDWMSVAWSPTLERFAAVASSGGTTDRFMYSDNGSSWTSGSMPAVTTVPTYTSVIWCPKYARFYTVADGGNERLANSLDGITWETFDYIDNTCTWESICWSPALDYFIAVASSGPNRLGTSTQAHTWYFQTVPDNEWSSICWSPELGLLVAVSRGLETNSVVTSDNLTDWTEVTPGFIEAWESVCWSAELELFVAVAKAGGSSYKRIMTSEDGANWIQHASPDRDFTSVCWSAELGVFSAVADIGSEVTQPTLTSIDGVTWEHPAEDFTDISFNSVCWGGSAHIFVAVASGGTEYRKMAVSTDGRIWNSRQSIVSNSWESVCWSSSIPLFVAVSSDGENDRVATSADGLSWAIQDAAEENSWKSVCCSDSLPLFVAVASDGTNRVMKSADGITWTPHASPAANSWTSVCWSPERAVFVAVSSDGTNRVMVSVDGATWTSVVAAETNPWRSVCWSSELGLFVAVAYSGTNKIMTSSTGYIWASRSTPQVSQLTSVCWSEEEGLFVAVSDDGEARVLVSYDGIEWKYRISVEGVDWQSVCWSPETELFVAVAGDALDNSAAMSAPKGGGITNYWVEDDYPAISWFYEQRHFFAATPSEPNAIWGSKTAEYTDMALGDGLDNDGIKFVFKTAVKFLWASVGKDMILGGSNAEFVFGANAINEALTPGNVRPVMLTNYGSKQKVPVRLGNNVVFLQRGGRMLRNLKPTPNLASNYGSFIATDLTLLSSHITTGGMHNYTAAFVPNQTLWAARTDGVLIGLTYEEENKIFGWHRHKLGGTDTKVSWVATTYATDNYDKEDLWAVVERTIDGNTVSYIEYMVEGLSDEQDVEDSFFVDAGITETGTSMSTVTGLDHLEGEEVAILGDGVPQDSKTVVSGSITLDTQVDKVHVGLGYDALVKTMPIEGGNDRMGTSQGIVKRIDRVSLRLDRSLDFSIGDVDDVFDEYTFESTSLFTGDTDPMPFTGSFDRQSCLQITHNTPLPFNLLAIMYEARTR